MTETAEAAQTAIEITPLPFWDRVVVRILRLLACLGIIGVLAWVMIATSRPSQVEAVVAARDLSPYQLLQSSDLTTTQVAQAGDIYEVDDLPLLPGRAILLTGLDKGQPVSSQSVALFAASVPLTDAVLVAIPWGDGQMVDSLLCPGSTALAVGNAISSTMPTFTSSVALVNVDAEKVVVAVEPQVAERLSAYLPPFGQVILVPSLYR